VSILADFRVFNQAISFSTEGEIEFVDLTDRVRDIVLRSLVRNGLAHVFAPRATGSLVLTENEHGLLEDIRAFLETLIPRDNPYAHQFNAHSHSRPLLFPPDKTLPLIDGVVELGKWQSLIFVETDVQPRKRTLIVQMIRQ
jgi:secondary thiamine-phosphate synthase enzyme